MSRERTLKARVLRRAAVRKGQCTVPGCKERLYTETMCVGCSARKREYERRRRAGRRVAGECSSCGKRLQTKAYVYCKACRERAKLYKRSMRLDFARIGAYALRNTIWYRPRDPFTKRAP
jgi:hypothetical protein